MVQYGFAALVGLIVDFGLVIFCKEILGFYYLIAVCIGFISGLAVTFILSNIFVFGKPKDNLKKLFLLFGVVGIVGLGILNVLVFFFTDILGLNYVVSKIIATGFVFTWNFFGRRALYHDEAPKYSA